MSKMIYIDNEDEYYKKMDRLKCDGYKWTSGKDIEALDISNLLPVYIYANECTGEIAYIELQSDGTKTISDNVNHPTHYNKYPVEVIESIKNLSTHEQFVGYLRGNITKYLARYSFKNGKEDLKKAKYYLEQLIDFEYGSDK